MSRSHRPDHPRLLVVFKRDPVVESLWITYAGQLVAQGLDPNNPPEKNIPTFMSYVHQNLEAMVPEATRLMMERWRQAAPADLDIRVGERHQTAQRVEDVWGTAFRGLDQFLSVCEEFGMIFVHRLTDARGDLPLTLRVLIALFTRGVQVGEETFQLLRSGFAAGAEGRWRTLHELAVVARFIAQHGENTADRYLRHNDVHVERSMRLEQQHHKALGAEPYTTEEMDDARTTVKELRKRFGQVFETDYGWAAADLGFKKEDRRGPTFADLEKCLDASHFRVLYFSASQNIHASVHGLISNPSQVPDRTPMFLTRGSEFGIRLPAANTMVSLYMLAHTLMTYWWLPHDVIGLKALGKLVEEVAAEFAECERRLDDQSPSPQ